MDAPFYAEEETIQLILQSSSSEDELDQIFEQPNEIQTHEESNLEFSDEDIEEEDEPRNQVKEEILEIQKDFEPYDYQLYLYKNSIEKNSIIFLETGRGKTHIALMHIYYYIKKQGWQNTKLVFLANTIQLVEQQCKYIRANIFSIAAYMEKYGLAPADHYFDLQLLKNDQFLQKFIIPIHSKSGSSDEEIDVQGWKKERWDEVVGESCVLVMMGQMLLNGLRRGYLKLPYFALIIFDECHHCNKSHSYRLIIQEFYEDEKVRKYIPNSDKVKFLGLTATPVTSVDIEKAVKNQRIKGEQIEIEMLQLAKNMHSKYVYWNSESIDTSIKVKKSEQIAVTISHEKLSYQPIIGVSQQDIPNQQYMTKFYQEWFQIVQKKDKIAFGIQLLVDQLFHFLTMYGLILYKELGSYSFYQFLKKLNHDFCEIKNLPNKTEEDQKILKRIKDLFRIYIDELKSFDELIEDNLSEKFKKLRGKLTEIKDQAQKKILIFVDHKITSKYLHSLLQQHNFECAYVVGTGNLSSGALQQTILKNKNKVTQLSLSQDVIAIADSIYNQFSIEGREENIDLAKNEDEDERTQIMLRVQLQEVLEGIKNYGKKLDQTVTNSKEQQKAILDFKGKCNILVSTNVTEEGFDVPSCHYVFIFGEITTFKQYVQKIGRARDKDSIVFFVIPKEVEQNQETKMIVMDKTKQIVNSRMKEINSENFYAKIDQRLKQLKSQYRDGQLPDESIYYESRLVKNSMALLNTNWAIEILSNYANLFRHFEYRGKDENYIRGIFYQYTQYPSVGWKCVLILPKNSVERYFVGDLLQNKEFAKRSAAFKAVLRLRERGLLTDDLRPIKSSIVYSLDRKHDPNMKDPYYCQIMEETVISLISKEDKVDLHQKLFPYKLEVFSVSIDQPFYLYQFKFYELPVMTNSNKTIGFIHNSSFCERHKFMGGKEIRIEKINKIVLNQDQYNLLFEVHKFLIATSFDWDIPFYSNLTKEQISKDSALFQQRKKEIFDSIDDASQYALFVLLTTPDDDDDKEIDFDFSKEILKYMDRMKEVFSLINQIRQKKQTNHKIKDERRRLNDDTLKFETWSKLQYDGELVKLIKDGNYKLTVVQNISDRYHLSKMVIQDKKQISEVIALQPEFKRNDFSLEIGQQQRGLGQIISFNFIDETELISAPILKKALKPIIAENREVIIQKKDRKAKYSYFSGELYKFPLDFLTCLKFRILIKFIMLQLRDFLVAFSFKAHGQKLWENKDKETPVPQYAVMNNLIVSDSLKLINFFADEFTLFQHLIDQLKQNCLMKIDQQVQKFILPNQSFDGQYSIHEIDNELLHRCFQSQSYNQSDQSNYQVLEFLGDAVLKMLSSIEIFVAFPLANENILHVERARIVSNENLRRASVINRFFHYIQCFKFEYWPQEFKSNQNKDIKEGQQVTKQGEPLKEIPHNYQAIPEKVHSDVVEALNGAFLLQYSDVNACQYFLHKIGVLRNPTTQIIVQKSTTLQCEGLMQSNLAVLESILGYKFIDQSLLVQAITHQSFLETLDYFNFRASGNKIVTYKNFGANFNLGSLQANEIDQSLMDTLNKNQIRSDMSYERLEYLGDSVLDSAVVEWLVDEYKQDKVEDLALKKQCVVCNKALALVTLHYKFDQFLLHPTLHKQDHDHYQTLKKIKKRYDEYYEDISQMYTQEPIIKILGDLFESLVGAIFVDTHFNYNFTKQVIFKLLMPFMEHFTSPNQISKNPQDRLFRHFKSKNVGNIEFALTDDPPINGENLYVLRDSQTYQVFQKIRAATEKQAREKLLEYISKRGEISMV